MNLVTKRVLRLITRYCGNRIIYSETPDICLIGWYHWFLSKERGTLRLQICLSEKIDLFYMKLSKIIGSTRMNMLEVSPDQGKYSRIFAHLCSSLIHKICLLSITVKASSYDLNVLFQDYKTICVQCGDVSFNHRFMLEDYLLHRLIVKLWFDCTLKAIWKYLRKNIGTLSVRHDFH